ncbi:MAG: hypothetical protein V4581_16725 [Bacteroidota bacterium]
MKKLSARIKAWRERREIKRACKAAGVELSDLESQCVYFKMTLTEMVAYHKFFGRLPHPDHTTVIRHIGMANLISEVKKQQATGLKKLLYGIKL